MDIFSHAIAGASTGYAFGHPVLGAAIAIVPDIPIFGPRRDKPSNVYMFTHSLAFLTIGVIIDCIIGWQLLATSALISHLVLDIPTHGKIWYPRLFWPFNYQVYHGVEWEFFNRPWKIGLCVTSLWCFLWLLISL